MFLKTLVRSLKRVVAIISYNIHKLTSAPIEFNAITIFLLSLVGYNQSVLNDIIQYFIFRIFES